MASNSKSVEQCRAIIRELNDVVGSARKTFINAETCVLSRGLLMDRLDQLDACLPEALKQAESIVQQDKDMRAQTAKECSEVLTSAQAQARQMLDDAQNQVAQLQRDTQNANETARRLLQEAQQHAQEERSRILQQANQEAQAIRAQAEQERDRLVSQETVFQKAMVEAEEIRESTNAELAVLRKNTFDYLDDVMGRMDQWLNAMTNEVRGERGALNNHR